jgi:hypothetical protein
MKYMRVPVAVLVAPWLILDTRVAEPLRHLQVLPVQFKRGKR